MRRATRNAAAIAVAAVCLHAAPNQAQSSVLAEELGGMPLHFIENQGQIDEEVGYYVQGRDKSLFFTPE